LRRCLGLRGLSDAGLVRQRSLPCLAIGGSAGGPLDLGATFIGTRQGVVQHKAAVIFCEMARGKSFAPFKSQNFEPTNQSWLVAQADPVSRTVHSVLDAHNRPRPVIEVLRALPLPAFGAGRACRT
jgi:hypothetical protein